VAIIVPVSCRMAEDRDPSPERNVFFACRCSGPSDARLLKSYRLVLLLMIGPKALRPSAPSPGSRRVVIITQEILLRKTTSIVCWTEPAGRLPRGFHDRRAGIAARKRDIGHRRPRVFGDAGVRVLQAKRNSLPSHFVRANG